MTNHHAIDGANEPAKHCQLFIIQFRAGTLDLRQVMMRVHGGGRVSWKMLSATQDPLPSHSVVERTREANDLVDGLSVAAAAQRIVRVVVKRNVEHGTKVEVEPEQPKQTAGDVAVPPDERNIAAITQLLGIRRFVPDQAQPGNAPAFLVYRDNRLDLAQVAQIVDQLPELNRASDVATEKDVAPGLNTPKQRGTVGIQFVAGNSSED